MPTLHQDWKSTPPAAQRSRGAAIADLTLLMVEDNRADAILIREMLVEGLPQVHFRISRAVSLSRAIEELDRASFDVVLLDLGLPDSFPDQVIDAVNAATGPGTAVVALTGRDDPALTRLLIDRNGEDYLVKGAFDAVTLGRTVQFAAMRARRRQAEQQRHETDARHRRFAALGWLAERLTEAVSGPQTASVDALQHALEGVEGLRRDVPVELRERLQVVVGDIERGLLEAIRAVDASGEVLAYVVPPTSPQADCDPVPPVQWAVRMARDWVPPNVDYVWLIEPCPRVGAHEQVLAQSCLAMIAAAAERFSDLGPSPDAGARMALVLRPAGRVVTLELRAHGGRNRVPADGPQAPCSSLGEVREAIEAVGGRVEVEHAHRRCTWRVELPLVDDETPRASAAHTVLAIDAGGSTGFAVGRMLPDSTVVIRRTVEDVLTHDLGLAFDLVVCTQRIDPETCAALRRHVLRPGGRLVVVSETQPTAEHCREALDEGYELLHLPFLRQELIR